MDKDIINLLELCSIDVSSNKLDGMLIERDILLSDSIYENVYSHIDILKKKYSSSSLTALQKNAKNEQRWPLLNLVRQLLRVENFNMTPIRKSDGYTVDGKKKYKRFFQIIKVKTDTPMENSP